MARVSQVSFRGLQKTSRLICLSTVPVGQLWSVAGSRPLQSHSTLDFLRLMSISTGMPCPCFYGRKQHVLLTRFSHWTTNWLGYGHATKSKASLPWHLALFLQEGPSSQRSPGKGPRQSSLSNYLDVLGLILKFPRARPKHFSSWETEGLRNWK